MTHRGRIPSGRARFERDGLHPFGIGIGRRPYAAQPERMGGPAGHSRPQPSSPDTNKRNGPDFRTRSRRTAPEPTSWHKAALRPANRESAVRSRRRTPRPLILSRRGRHGGAQQQFDLLRLDAPVLIGTDARARKNGLQRRLVSGVPVVFGVRLRPTMRRYLRRDRFRSSFPTTIFMSGGKSPDEPDGSGCVPSCDRLVSAAADCPAEQRYGKISRKRQEEMPFSTRFGWKSDFRTIRTSLTFLFRRNLHHAKLPE